MSTDRTQEFLQVANSLPDRVKPLSGNTSSNQKIISASTGKSKNSSNASLRSFHATASGISRDIAGTSQLLAELTKLVRRRGLFTEETDNVKVNDLIIVIKQNVQNLNLRLDDAAAIITKEKAYAKKGSQSVLEASNLVGRLQEEFVATTSGFKDVLQQRSDRIKETKDWKQQLGGGNNKFGGSTQKLHLGPKPSIHGQKKSFQPVFQPLDLGLTPTMSSGDRSSSLGSNNTPSGEGTAQLPRPRGVVGEGGGALHTPTLTHRTPSALTPIQIQRMEAESGNEQMMQLIPDQSYLQDRADQMSQVEENIVELGTIFNKLAVMVNEHKEMVHRIEDNAEEANQSIQASLFQLTSTLESLRTNRALAMKVSGVLILFIILFVTFFA